MTPSLGAGWVLIGREHSPHTIPPETCTNRPAAGTGVTDPSAPGDSAAVIDSAMNGRSIPDYVVSTKKIVETKGRKKHNSYKSNSNNSCMFP